MINREEEIINLLQVHHSLSFHELSQMLFISEPTARRDVAKLEKNGIVKRIYGGVTLAKFKNEVIPVNIRDGENSAAKEQVAKKAARLINDGDTVFFDSSSTVRRICRYITDRKDLTIITNNMRVLKDLQDTDINVYCVGGKYYKRRECFLGGFAEKFIESTHADMLFFSSQGISLDGFISDVDEEEISLRQKMMKHSDKKYYLCDHSKIGVVKSLKECDISEIDAVICDVQTEFEKQ